LTIYLSASIHNLSRGFCREQIPSSCLRVSRACLGISRECVVLIRAKPTNLEDAPPSPPRRVVVDKPTGDPRREVRNQQGFLQGFSRRVYSSNGSVSSGTLKKSLQKQKHRRTHSVQQIRTYCVPLTLNYC